MNYDVTGKVNAIKTDIADTEDEEFDDYDDEDLDFENFEENETEKSEEPKEPESNNKKDLKKKLIMLMIIIGGGMLVLLLLLSLVSKLMARTYKYEDVEEIMKNAAISYFDEHKSNLPQDETQTVEIEVANLVAAEKMKTLEDYLGEGNGCTGKVQVKLSGKTYIYTPYLSCGDKYSTKFLAEEIAKEENLVGTGYGLYLMNDNYVFRGETVNNYVKLDAKVWRIVRVNSDKTIKMILDMQNDYDGYPYDNRYNQEVNLDIGINNYQTSRIREYLQKIYTETADEKSEKTILTEADKTHLVNFDICIGKMSKTDTIHDNSKECMTTVSEKIGLLTVSDYMNASIDNNCTSVASSSCENYNYLANIGSYWLVTPSTSNTYTAFYVASGRIREEETKERNYLRPVITLSSNTLISGGDGTEANPYIIK